MINSPVINVSFSFFVSIPYYNSKIMLKEKARDMDFYIKYFLKNNPLSNSSNEVWVLFNADLKHQHCVI